MGQTVTNRVDISKAGSACCKRLAGLDNLYVPASMAQSNNVTFAAKTDYLENLLERDPAVFLERNGRLMLQSELDVFQQYASGDYEVSWHLARLSAAPSSAVVKNRRLAMMNSRTVVRRGLCSFRQGFMVVCGAAGRGSYFSEESMRERNPLLFQEAVGKVIEERPPTCLSEAILHRYARPVGAAGPEAERHAR
eukprot:jgi/Mesvir1/8352/Mv12612-RA.1